MEAQEIIRTASLKSSREGAEVFPAFRELLNLFFRTSYFVALFGQLYCKFTLEQNSCTILGVL